MYHVLCLKSLKHNCSWISNESCHLSPSAPQWDLVKAEDPQSYKKTLQTCTGVHYPWDLKSSVFQYPPILGVR